MNWSPEDPSRIIAPTAMRSLYAHLTDKLIHEVEALSVDATPHLMFLDKSGRPVAWLVRALWDVYARVPGTVYTENVVPHMPSMSFANIDRVQWWDVTGASETGTINVMRVPAEQAMQLRVAYLRERPPPGIGPGACMGAPTWLDGKTIVVIDEVRASGDTLAIAGGLVQRAFPDNRVLTSHWMTPEVRRGKESGVAQQIRNPVWYRSDTSRGRLVGDRLASDHRGSHWRGKLAPLFMSTVPAQRDTMGIQLRHEVAELARDVAKGELLALPALTRESEDIATRIQTLYGFSDLRAFTAARIAQT